MNIMVSVWLLEKFLEISGFLSKAFAQSGSGTGRPPSGSGSGGSETFDLPNPLGTNDFRVVLGKVIDGLFNIAVPFLAIMILIGGFQLMFAGGKPENITRGKKTILYSVIGFAVILVAEGVRFIIQDLLGS